MRFWWNKRKEVLTNKSFEKTVFFLQLNLSIIHSQVDRSNTTTQKNVQGFYQLPFNKHHRKEHRGNLF